MEIPGPDLRPKRIRVKGSPFKSTSFGFVDRNFEQFTHLVIHNQPPTGSLLIFLRLDGAPGALRRSQFARPLELRPRPLCVLSSSWSHNRVDSRRHRVTRFELVRRPRAGLVFSRAVHAPKCTTRWSAPNVSRYKPHEPIPKNESSRQLHSGVPHEQPGEPPRGPQPPCAPLPHRCVFRCRASPATTITKLTRHPQQDRQPRQCRRRLALSRTFHHRRTASCRTRHSPQNFAITAFALSSKLLSSLSSRAAKRSRMRRNASFRKYRPAIGSA